MALSPVARALAMAQNPGSRSLVRERSAAGSFTEKIKEVIMTSKASQEQNNKPENLTEKESDEFVTIKIPRTFLREWEELANEFGIPLEELLQDSIEEILKSYLAESSSIDEYLLKKNAELYRRLA